jgi:hypothetical protein
MARHGRLGRGLAPPVSSELGSTPNTCRPKTEGAPVLVLSRRTGDSRRPLLPAELAGRPRHATLGLGTGGVVGRRFRPADSQPVEGRLTRSRACSHTVAVAPVPATRRIRAAAGVGSSPEGVASRNQPRALSTVLPTRRSRLPRKAARRHPREPSRQERTRTVACRLHVDTHHVDTHHGLITLRNRRRVGISRVSLDARRA